MKNKIFICLSLLLLCFGCKDTQEGDDGAGFSEHFIQAYFIADMFNLSYAENQPNYIALFVSGRKVDEWGRSKDPEQEFNQLKTFYNDIAYNGKLVPNINHAVGNSVGLISITCDKDFLGKYKAGEPLDGFVKLCAEGAYEFISNGYKYKNEKIVPEELEAVNMGRKRGYVPIFKTLNSLTVDDLKLINTKCYLYFEEIPDSGEYTFTVKVKIDEETVERQITCQF